MVTTTTTATKIRQARRGRQRLFCHRDHRDHREPACRQAGDAKMVPACPERSRRATAKTAEIRQGRRGRQPAYRQAGGDGCFFLPPRTCLPAVGRCGKLLPLSLVAERRFCLSPLPFTCLAAYSRVGLVRSTLSSPLSLNLGTCLPAGRLEIPCWILDIRRGRPAVPVPDCQLPSLSPPAVRAAARRSQLPIANSQLPSFSPCQKPLNDRQSNVTSGLRFYVQGFRFNPGTCRCRVPSN